MVVQCAFGQTDIKIALLYFELIYSTQYSNILAQVISKLAKETNVSIDPRLKMKKMAE